MSEDIKEEINRQMPDMTCPRRMNEVGPWERAENLDLWEKRNDGKLHCSFCGSLHPDEFMRLIEAGSEVIPTDKSYKAYLKFDTGEPQRTEVEEDGDIKTTIVKGGVQETKFYYPHLSAEQRKRFIELYNTNVMKLDYPGYFYVRPYFCVPKPKQHD